MDLLLYLFANDDSGIIKFPAIRIKSKPYEDVLLLFMDAKGEVVGNGDIHATFNGNAAHLNFRGSGKTVSETSTQIFEVKKSKGGTLSFRME